MYFLHFLSTHERDIDLDTVEYALITANPDFSFIRDESGRHAEVYYRKNLHGEVTVYPRESEEGVELLRELDEGTASDEEPLTFEGMMALGDARAIVEVRVLKGDRGFDETAARFDPLWQFLFTHRRGVMHVGKEGFRGMAHFERREHLMPSF